MVGPENEGLQVIFLLKMMDFVLQMMDFVLKMVDLQLDEVVFTTEAHPLSISPVMCGDVTCLEHLDAQQAASGPGSSFPTDNVALFLTLFLCGLCGRRVCGRLERRRWRRYCGRCCCGWRHFIPCCGGRCGTGWSSNTTPVKLYNR